MLCDEGQVPQQLFLTFTTYVASLMPPPRAHQRAERRERDRLGGSWTPKWFNKIESPELYDGELDLDKVGFRMAGLD